MVEVNVTVKLLVIDTKDLSQRVAEACRGQAEIEQIDTIHEAQKRFTRSKLQRSPADLVILDIDTPDTDGSTDSGSGLHLLNGIEQKICGNSLTHEEVPPIFVVTSRYALAQADVVWQCHGVVGYAPFNDRTLRDIREMISRMSERKWQEEAAKDAHIAVGSYLPLSPGEYKKRKFVSLFIGRMRSFMVHLKEIIEPLRKEGSPDLLRSTPNLTQIVEWERERRQQNVEQLPTFEGKQLSPPYTEHEIFRRKHEAPARHILLEGETGVGKALIAEMIGEWSRGVDAPFIQVNCTGIPEKLLESELFGYLKGSHAEADETHVGQIFSAAGGTLFLDEIGDMALPLQAKLLTFFDNGLVSPIGWYGKGIYIPVRVVAATNRNLPEEIKNGRFRDDLYQRFRHRVTVPPMRERMEDLEYLIDFVLQNPDMNDALADDTRAITAISTKAVKKLRAYGYPGNFRELEFILREAVIRARGYRSHVILEEDIRL